MKKFFTLFASVAMTVVAFAQTTIYSENMGTPTNTTTAISANPFQNGAPITYSGSADIRTSSPSSTSNYAGASGGANVFITGTVGTNFLISGIDTSNYTNLQLSFGQHKSTTAANNQLLVEVSADGTNWTSLTYSRPTGSGTANYILVTPTGTIPSATNLSIRFTNNLASTQWRLDDITLTGNSNGSLATNEVKGNKNVFVKNTLVDSELNFGANGDVKIYNVNGQVVKEAKVSADKALNVQDLNKGTYIVTGTVNGNKVSEKIIKK